MKRPTFSVFLLAIILAFACGGPGEITLQPMGELKEELSLPVRDGSLKLAVIGDSGTGGRHQYEIGQRLFQFHEIFPFDTVLMMGDNLYGGEDPDDYVEKFKAPFKPLLEQGVKFYAVLGNHDEPAQRFYKDFNMGGERYYSFTRENVLFLGLDSNYMDEEQVAWLKETLAAGTEDWKIAYFHHPIYSSGARHGSDKELREVLEPIFLEYGVNVVFAGHEHFYERIEPQKNIHYFTSGAAAKLRRGNIEEGSPLTAQGFDEDRSFLLVEIDGDEFYFQAISRTGEVIDRGDFTLEEATPALPSGG